MFLPNPLLEVWCVTRSIFKRGTPEKGRRMGHLKCFENMKDTKKTSQFYEKFGPYKYFLRVIIM